MSLNDITLNGTLDNLSTYQANNTRDIIKYIIPKKLVPNKKSCPYNIFDKNGFINFGNNNQFYINQVDTIYDHLYCYLSNYYLSNSLEIDFNINIINSSNIYNFIIAGILAELNNLYYIPYTITKKKTNINNIFIFEKQTEGSGFIVNKKYINFLIISIIINKYNLGINKFKLNYINFKLAGQPDDYIRSRAIHNYVIQMPNNIKNIFNKTVKIKKSYSNEQLYKIRYNFIKKYDNFKDFNNKYDKYIIQSIKYYKKLIKTKKIKTLYNKYLLSTKKIKFNYDNIKKNKYFTKNIHNKVVKFCKLINYKLI